MSLELALQENTAAIRELIAIVRTNTAMREEPIALQPLKGEEGPTPVVTETPAPAAEIPTAAHEAPAEEQENAPETPPVDYEAVKKATLELAKIKGREAAATVLGNFKVSKAPELKPEQYAAFVEAATSELAA